MRLIDANSLEELIWRSSRRAIQDVIQNAPTIEAERIRHGHWERPIDAYTIKSYKWKCSVCGEIAYARPVVCLSVEQQKCIYKYCPYCGAKMDEMEERREDVRITDNN